MESEQIPQWAIELIKQVERLNEKLPNHIEWVERNLRDHENRLRTLESFRWILIGVSLASGGLGAYLTKILGS